jgi:hypothetical protein
VDGRFHASWECPIEIERTGVCDFWLGKRNSRTDRGGDSTESGRKGGIFGGIRRWRDWWALTKAELRSNANG